MPSKKHSLFLPLSGLLIALIFGVALILMMRLKPEGLWPSTRIKQELHEHGTTGEGMGS